MRKQSPVSVSDEEIERALINMPHIVPRTYVADYIRRIVTARHDPELLKELVGEKADGLRLKATRDLYQRDLAELERRVLHPAVVDIVTGILQAYGPLNGESFTTRIVYQARRRNGRIVEGGFHGKQNDRLAEKLVQTVNFCLDRIPSLVRQPAFPDLDAVVLAHLRKEREGTYEPEILNRALEIEFPRGHPSAVDRIIFSDKAGEKLPMKSTGTIYGTRGERIVDVLRARVLIDSDAFKERNGTPGVRRAHEIFYSIFPFFTDEIRKLKPDEKGFPPAEKRRAGFLDAWRTVYVMNVRRQLNPDFRPAESEKILRGLDRVPLQRRSGLYQYLKAGFIFHGGRCNFPPNVIRPEVAEGYLPAVEIQVTTSNRHRTNEQYGRTDKETYTLFDMAKTMVKEGWTGEMFETYRMLAESNILGTRYNGPIPEWSEYHLIRKRAEVIWNVLVPKVRKFYDPKNGDRLARAIQRELHQSKNLKYYLAE